MKHVTRGTRALALALFLLSACGDGTSRIEIEILYPTEGARHMTGSLHLWILSDARRGSSEEPPPGCTALVSRSVGPYDFVFRRLVDQVFVLPEEPTPSVGDVPKGRALIYVEAVDYVGQTLLAGCAEERLTGGTLTLELRMSAPGTFDCTDPVVEDGAPCDDGQICTVGSVCQSGTCVGGNARDCSYLANNCNSASCDEEQGCLREPLPDGTSCDDGLHCTVGNLCVAGLCIGADRDCSAVETPCHLSECNEALSACQPVQLEDGAMCDDNDACTINTTCASGACLGEFYDCSQDVMEDDCNQAACDSVDGCYLQQVNEGGDCDDGDACTASICVIGSCEEVGPRDCVAEIGQQDCKLTVCDPVLEDCVFEDDPDQDGDGCDDGDPCTENTTCDAGECTGGNPVASPECND